MLVELKETDINTGKVILYFSASWCEPCKTFSPVFEKVAAEIETPCVKVDAESNFELSQKFQISSIPTVLILENGKVSKKNSGHTPENLFRSFIG